MSSVVEIYFVLQWSYTASTCIVVTAAAEVVVSENEGSGSDVCIGLYWGI